MVAHGVSVGQRAQHTASPGRGDRTEAVFCRPYRGFHLVGETLPRAHARGYILPPLSGLMATPRVPFMLFASLPADLPRLDVFDDFGDEGGISF